jgi:type IV fimbrial biogenesis protein FimT
MDSRHRQSGFTLWELLVALLVAGILVGIGVPSLTAAQRNAAMSGAANDLITGLLAARAEAVKRQVPVTLCASPDPTAANPVCSQNGAGSNGGFIVWVDWDPAHVDANGTPTFTATDGNAAVDPNEVVLIRTAAPASAAPSGTLRIFAAAQNPVNSGYVSFGPTGFVRQATGVGFGSVQWVLYCDDRGNKQSAGPEVSTARVIRIDNTGRANVETATADVANTVGLIPGAACP